MDAPGGNLLPVGCSSFKATPATYRRGDKTWACPKFWLINTVTQPPAKAACVYRKIGARP